MNPKKLIFIVFLVVILLSIPIYVMSQNQNHESTTEQVHVLAKERNSDGQWVILEDQKKVFVENFSIWALIREKEDYTATYITKSGTHELTTIVPADYEGQF
jgi:trans-2-enoyl-CoA reductase